MEYSELKKRHFGTNDTDKKITEKISEIKSEAYKEFAKKLKNEINIRTTYSREQDKNVMRMIDNLVKEMVGERRMTDNQEAEKALKKLK